MTKIKFKNIACIGLVLLMAGLCRAAERNGLFAGQDLHLSGSEMTVHKDGLGNDLEHILVFGNGFAMSIGDNQLSSAKAVVWLKTARSEYRGQVEIDYNCQVYLENDVAIVQGLRARTTELNEFAVEQGEALAARFLVSGEVYATAQTQTYATASLCFVRTFSP